MPFKVLRAKVAQLERVAEQAAGRFGDDHRARLGRALQARREIMSKGSTYQRSIPVASA